MPVPGIFLGYGKGLLKAINNYYSTYLIVIIGNNFDYIGPVLTAVVAATSYCRIIYIRVVIIVLLITRS